MIIGDRKFHFTILTIHMRWEVEFLYSLLKKEQRLNYNFESNRNLHVKFPCIAQMLVDVMFELIVLDLYF